jgi:hypothetical protein
MGTRKIAGSLTPIRKPDAAANSDQHLAVLLTQLKKTLVANETRQLADQIERIIFHKPLTNA